MNDYKCLRAISSLFCFFSFVKKNKKTKKIDRVSVLEDRSLRLERVTVADEGEYSCEADNVVGAITAMGMLTVYGKFKFKFFFLCFGIITKIFVRV